MHSRMGKCGTRRAGNLMIDTEQDLGSSMPISSRCQSCWFSTYFMTSISYREIHSVRLAYLYILIFSHQSKQQTKQHNIYLTHKCGFKGFLNKINEFAFP